MASIYRRENSPFWWIKWRGPDGKVRRQSTNLKTSVTADTRSARELCASRSLDETRSAAPDKRPGAWDSWVRQFFESKYTGATNTLASYSGCWRSLSAWLDEMEIDHPQKLTRELCAQYPEWRKSKRQFSYKAGRNTAIHELKILRLVMSEAVRRGYVQSNPCVHLELRRDPVKEKPEITPDEERAIRSAIELEPAGDTKQFLEASFLIAIYQGCRLRETCVPLADINEDAGTIRFLQKGQREHVTMLHPDLVPIVRRWRQEGRTYTYEPRFKRRGGSVKVNPTLIWSAFLRRLGLGHLCFHSTRVTVASRLARANVHEAKAMRFIGHAFMMVHRLYQRLRVVDLKECVDAVGSAGTRRSPETQGVPPATSPPPSR